VALAAGLCLFSPKILLVLVQFLLKECLELRVLPAKRGPLVQLATMEILATMLIMFTIVTGVLPIPMIVKGIIVNITLSMRIEITMVGQAELAVQVRPQRLVALEKLDTKVAVVV
jgi:hypothetical protein